MKLKQRDILVNIIKDLSRLKRYASHLEKQVSTLCENMEKSLSEEADEFTSSDVDLLFNLNKRLRKLERYLYDCGKNECAKLDARIADPDDPLDDYEIEATLYFVLRENDPEYDDSSDNFLTQRVVDLKNLRDWGDWGMNDGNDHCEYGFLPHTLRPEEPHCWLFHDLYDHSYTLERSALSLHDCLRVGIIWVDVAVRHQATLNIATGKWQAFSRPNDD